VLKCEHVLNLQQMETGHRSRSPTNALRALELMFVDAEGGDF
jgi:hypothetical protein